MLPRLSSPLLSSLLLSALRETNARMAMDGPMGARADWHGVGVAAAAALVLPRLGAGGIQICHFFWRDLTLTVTYENVAS